MEGSERRGDPSGHAGLRERGVRHGPAVQELHNGGAARRKVMEHGGPDAERGGDARVVELVRPVNGRADGRRARNPHDERLAVDVDPVVRVGEPVRQRLDGHGPAAPRVDEAHDLFHGGRRPVAHRSLIDS